MSTDDKYKYLAMVLEMADISRDSIYATIEDYDEEYQKDVLDAAYKAYMSDDVDEITDFVMEYYPEG